MTVKKKPKECIVKQGKQLHLSKKSKNLEAELWFKARKAYWSCRKNCFAICNHEPHILNPAWGGCII